MADIKYVLGLKDAGLTFESIADRGNVMLKALRAEEIAHTKAPREWNAKAAAELIGRSAVWLRDHDTKNPVLSPSGLRVYTLERINAIRDEIGTRFKRPNGSDAFIIPVVNFKGGVGKSTHTVHLAQAAAIQGWRVLVIDLDPQASATFALGGVVPDLELDPEDTVLTALLDDASALPSVIRKTYFEGVDLIPASLAIQDLDLSLPNPNVSNEATLGHGLLRLKNALTPVKDRYDLILLDCAPNIAALTCNALCAANGLIIPVPPSTYDIASMIMFSRTLGSVYSGLRKHKLGGSLDYFRILITKYDVTGQENAYPMKRMSPPKEAEAKLRQLCENLVLSNYMVHSAEIERAARDMGTLYDTGKPRASRDTYQRAITRMDAVNNEILEELQTVWNMKHGG